MLLIGTGFFVPFLFAFWLAGWVGSVRQSALIGGLAGLIGFLALMAGYFVLLYFWARAKLIAFIETQVPLIMERLEQLVPMLDKLLAVRDVI